MASAFKQKQNNIVPLFEDFVFVEKAEINKKMGMQKVENRKL